MTNSTFIVTWLVLNSGLNCVSSLSFGTTRFCWCLFAEQEYSWGGEAGTWAIRGAICPHETLPDEIRHAHCRTRTGGLLQGQAWWPCGLFGKIISTLCVLFNNNTNIWTYLESLYSISGWTPLQEQPGLIAHSPVVIMNKLTIVCHWKCMLLGLYLIL